MPDQIMIPLEIVTEIANWLLYNRDASVVDVMAEFDLSDEEALYALATARYVVRKLEEEALAN